MKTSSYVAGLSFHQFLAKMTLAHPALAGMIDPDKVKGIDAHLQRMDEASWEFEGFAEGGRGFEYNLAQQNAGNRREGMMRLLRLFSPSGEEMPGPDCVILDALAGDGTIARFVSALPVHPTLISADLSAYMIEQCLGQDLPCIRQSASMSLLRDSAVDGVLIAYGSHHLTPEDRLQAAREAWRTLKTGGRFVLHDFEIGGAVDRWFAEVVHPYSKTGHPHPHFSRSEMWALLDGAGFRDPQVIEIDDAFTLTGKTPEEARLRMLHHLHNMYGLTKLDLETPEDHDAFERLVAATLGQIEIGASNGSGWLARLSRMALVAVGTK